MTVLRVEDVTVRFAGLVALSGVSLALEAGSIGAVIGPNGAGKSTLFGAISGYVRPQTGRVLFDGADMTQASPTQAARAGMRRTFQNGGIFPELTVLENMLTGLPESWRFGMLGTALGLPRSRRAEAGNVRAARAAGADGDRRSRGPAGGRPAGRAAAHRGDQPRARRPRPSVAAGRAGGGLTQAELDTLGGVLRRLAADGLAILLVEHVIDFVMALAGRVLVLNHGQVLAEGTPAEVRADDAVLEAYLGHR